MKSSIVLGIVFFVHFSFSQSINLKDVSNQYDYVIITVPQFESTCQQFKQHKETVRGFRVLIVDTTAIYQQFDSCTANEDRIRHFISYAGTYWKNPQPKYFLIAGDLNKIPNYSFVTLPEYQYTDTTKTDFYFSESIYDEDTTTINFYVGRIAAKTTTDLENYFQKVITYENNLLISEWDNTSLVVADDEKNASGEEGEIWKNISLILRDNYLPTFLNRKLYSSSDTSIYFGNKDSITSFLENKGASTLFFIGHGNSTQFTHENLFNVSDVPLLNVGQKYFFVSFLAKQQFSDSNSTSITDQMLVNESQAIGGMSPLGLYYADLNSNVINNFAKYLYSGYHLTVGQVMDSIFINDKTSFKKIFGVFGDPSLKLKYGIIADVNGGQDLVVSDFLMEQNFPNPFNPTTTFQFSLPKAGNVHLKIFDVLGNEVASVADGFYNSGTYKIVFSGERLASGIYLYTLNSGNFHQSKKMILMK